MPVAWVATSTTKRSVSTMFSASVHTGAFLMDGSPAIHLCLPLKAMNRPQALGIKFLVSEEAENLGIDVQSRREEAYAKWQGLLSSNEIAMRAVALLIG